MKFLYLVLLFLCYCIFNSYERITSQKITTDICEDNNYKVYCANATLIETKTEKNKTQYKVKNGNWEKIYVKQCFHEVTKNNENIKECRPCYYKTYQEVCRKKNFDVYCNNNNFENKYCNKIEYIVSM
ncbi:hypothetical protein U3516DRAFT_907458 [Neocallimastix sp. 'constans']|jgi:hypothetical protein